MLAQDRVGDVVLFARLGAETELDRHVLAAAGHLMMDAAEAALIGLGVPPERVHTERFDMV